MSEQIENVKVEVEGQTFFVIGDEFEPMKETVKRSEGRKWDGEGKQWVLKTTIGVARKHLESQGLKMVDSLNNLPPTDLAIAKKRNGNGNNGGYKNTTSVAISAPIEPFNTDQILAMYSPDNKIDGNEIMQDYGISYNAFARLVVGTALYFQDKVKDNNGNPAPMILQEVLTHSLDCLTMGVDTSRWSMWRDYKGNLTKQLDYQVAESWIRQEAGKMCIIHTIILEGTEKMKHTSDERDLVAQCFVVHQDDRREVLKNINPDSAMYRGLNKGLSVPDSMEIAKNQLVKNWSMFSGVGIVTVDERFEIMGTKGSPVIKGGLITLKLDAEGNPIAKKGVNPNGRGDLFKVEKRGKVAAANDIGAINFNNAEESLYKIGVDKPKLRADNPVLDKADEAKQAQHLSPSTITSEKAKEASNLMHGPEDFEGFE